MRVQLHHILVRSWTRFQSRSRISRLTLTNALPTYFRVPGSAMSANAGLPLSRSTPSSSNSPTVKHLVFTGRMFDAINGMLLDMLAAIARKDYDDRRRRQAQGIAKAKADGKMKGRPEDAERNEALVDMLRKGQSWSSIVAALNARVRRSRD